MSGLVLGAYCCTSLPWLAAGVLSVFDTCWLLGGAVLFRL